MKITRLSWAGLMVQSASTTLYIDPLQNVESMATIIGPPRFPIFPIPMKKDHINHALITHVHPDHFDIELLAPLLSSKGEMWAPEPVCSIALEKGLKANPAKLYEPITIGDLKITPVPAVDWVGDEQVSYVISDGKYSIFHGGDTNWHGYWWKIAKRFGPFNLVFLPVNGVVGYLPGISPISNMSGTMNPAQAVTATRLLGSQILVPMHYGQFEYPPQYNEYPDIDKNMDIAGKDQQINIYRMKDGEVVIL